MNIEVPDIEFHKFNKIPRLHRECVITEKIDGTNATIYISPEGAVHAASRTRWITPDSDNHGFAQWVSDNQETLKEELGEGWHRGEWCGAKIQRGYGVTERHFVLFDYDKELPEDSCCKKVPVLYRGMYNMDVVKDAVWALRSSNSRLFPKWDRPEGIVFHHLISGHRYKVLLENDEGRKGKRP